MKTDRTSSDGFTIVEILVAIVVSGIIIGSLTQVVTAYVHLAARGRYLNLANAYAEAKVESLRNTGYNSLTPGTTNLKNELSSQLPRSKDASMTVDPPAGGLKQVELTISYQYLGELKSYSYTTYIGELGVGQ